MRGAPGLARLQPPELFHHGIQPLALDELHDVIRQAVLLADAEDRHDVGVVQPGGRFCLALEPAPGAGVEQHVPGQHLERHMPAQ